MTSYLGFPYLNGCNFAKNYKNYSYQDSLESWRRVVIETGIALKSCISICGVISKYRETIAYFVQSWKVTCFRRSGYFKTQIWRPSLFSIASKNGKIIWKKFRANPTGLSASPWRAPFLRYRASKWLVPGWLQCTVFKAFLRTFFTHIFLGLGLTLNADYAVLNYARGLTLS